MSESNDSTGIRQIARHAGVSTATVSRVLNGSANVSLATRERVLKAVSANNYRPNAAAKALATRRTRTIAAVIPTLEYSIFAVFMNALEDQLATAGYSLVIATHRFDYETELRRCQEVLKLGAEAIILSGTEHDAGLLRLLENTAVPCLYTSVYEPSGAVPSMGYDNAGLAYRAIDYLASLGHRRISVVHGPLLANDRMRLRVAGTRAADQSIVEISVTLHEVPMGAGGAAALAQQWFDEQCLPDACLCLTDVFALGVLLEAQRHGVTIPQQMSVMGFEDVELAAHCSPRLTTIALPSSDMGKSAAMALVNHLDQGEALEHRQFDAVIVERESTRRLEPPR